MTDLDRLITRNRDRLEVGLASEAEIARVTVDKIDDAPRKEIDCWHLIAFRGREDGEPVTSLRCLGFTTYGDTWITSDVLAIASDRSVLQTTSRIYALREPASGKIHPRLVGMVRQALAAWGFDEALDLGIWDRSGGDDDGAR